MVEGANAALDMCVNVYENPATQYEGRQHNDVAVA